MAMFKEGDRVQYCGPDGRAYPEKGTVLSVKTVKGDVLLTVQMDGGKRRSDSPEDLWEEAWNSSNPVVANALGAARAANAVFVGDAVRALERNLLEMERVNKEYFHLKARDRRVKDEVDRIVVAKATPDERKRLDALRRAIFAASMFDD